MTEMGRRQAITVVGAVTAVATAGLAAPGLWPAPQSGGQQRVRTSFGSVALLSSARFASTRGGRTHAAHASEVTGRPVASRIHGAWSDAVLVDVEVRNDGGRAVLLSPGQFRLRVDQDGPTVSLYASDRDAGPLGPGVATTMRITYLAPSPGHRLWLEYDGSEVPTQVVRLGPVGRRPAGALT